MLSPGTLLSSRYKIESVLGQGGMGAVYLATMEALGNKKVAVKEMELKGFSSEELAQAVQQFKKEASFLANLDHPNLVQVTDFFVEDDKHYLVMAYVTGETLQQKLRAFGQPFSWDKVRSYAEPLVDVLHYLHTQNPPILFRDLKPSNIMVEESGRLRLIDFGIARTAQAGDRTSTFLQGTGTSGFSPIEQYGGGQSTDQRSDIYALGATLYYLLTGKIPPDAVARISQGSPLIAPTELQPNLPKEVDALLNKALALRQPERHASMMEFKREMMAISSLDMEGATEDFGELPAVGESARPSSSAAPSTKVPPSENRPAAIMVEMFPTAQQEPQHSYTPWVIGGGSLLVASFAVLAMISKFLPPEIPSQSASPQPAATRNIETIGVSDARSYGSENDASRAEPVDENSPPQVLNLKPKTRQISKPTYYENKPLNLKSQDTRSASKPKKKPKEKRKSPNMGTSSYPKSSYPKAKPREKKPEPEQVVKVVERVKVVEKPVEKPVSTTRPERQQRPGNFPHGHQPPPPFLDKDGNPIPPPPGFPPPPGYRPKQQEPMSTRPPGY